WFTYPGEENWIPLTTDRVKEIHQLNKEGVRPEEIGAVVLEEVVEEKPVSYDYENVVGQDSLTRLDERNKKKRRSKGKRKPDGQRPGPKPENKARNAGQSAPPSPANEGKPKSKKRFRGNRRGKSG